MPSVFQCLSVLRSRLIVLHVVGCGLLVAACASTSGAEGTGTDPVGSQSDAGGPEFTRDAATSAVIDKCKVSRDDENGGGLACTKVAPPGAFAPATKWSWKAPSELGVNLEGSMVIPLVANLTDDNGDGNVDLCDVPDVVVTVFNQRGKIHMLSGDKGALEVTFDGNVEAGVTPAIGDLDGDGVPEVVTHDTQGHLVAYDPRGKIKWVGPDAGGYIEGTNEFCHAVAIYDLDGDGAPEIISWFDVFDNKGRKKFSHSVSDFKRRYFCAANTAADLDGDGKLEVVFGNAAYGADGSLLWQIPGPPGQPQVANLDGDPEPEIFVAREDGILILEHTGAIKLGPVKLIDEPTSPNCWAKPGAIHDFDGDGVADLSASTCFKYGVYGVGSAGLTLNWTATINDKSGIASTTAFDFLGRGIAQAVYGDQDSLYVFDGKTGDVNLRTARASGTYIEYPVVADVDNDQSADILVVSNSNYLGGEYKVTLEVFQDAERRWIPTRRIWNQHAYHVTNVREDGTIPAKMGKSWQRQNTFRTNTQIDGNGDCAPLPPNPK